MPTTVSYESPVERIQPGTAETALVRQHRSNYCEDVRDGSVFTALDFCARLDHRHEVLVSDTVCAYRAESLSAARTMKSLSTSCRKTAGSDTVVRKVVTFVPIAALRASLFARLTFFVPTSRGSKNHLGAAALAVATDSIPTRCAG